MLADAKNQQHLGLAVVPCSDGHSDLCRYFFQPAGYTALPLTDDLFSFIHSTDPELRDSIGLEVFFHGLDRGHYCTDDIRRLVPRLLANQQAGLGEKESVSVFQRSFSSLWLALIIQNENQKPVLDRDELMCILEALVTYFSAGKGCVPNR